MLKTAVVAVLALVALASNAEARQRHRAIAPICDNIDTMRPCAYQPNFLAGVREIRVTMIRNKFAKNAKKSRSEEINLPAPSFSIARPLRYIAGRLICAINVNAALAERGIRGTGSALAMSFRHWGRSAGGPVPGAVILSARRGGGHVAIVSRVVNGVVYAWNATGGKRGWREIPYRHHVIDYRVPG